MTFEEHAVKMGMDHSHSPLLMGSLIRLEEWITMEGVSMPRIFVYLPFMEKMLVHIYQREPFLGQLILSVEEVGDIFMESLAQRFPISIFRTEDLI